MQPYIDWRKYNLQFFCTPGLTSSEITAPGGWYERALADRPSYIHLMMGTNDIRLIGPGNQLPSQVNANDATLQANVLRAIALARAARVPLYLGTIPPYYRTTDWWAVECYKPLADKPVDNRPIGCDWWERPELTLAYNAWLRTLSGVPGVYVIDYFPLWADSDGIHFNVLLTDDGGHPNGLGYAPAIALFVKTVGLRDNSPY